MTPRRTCLALVTALALSACGTKPPADADPQPAPTPKPAQEVQPAQEAATTGSEAPAQAKLPAVDRACSGDEDCVAASAMYESAGQCCRSCATVAGNVTWLEAAKAACASQGSEGCPLKKCVPLAEVSCVDGQCQVK